MNPPFPSMRELARRLTANQIASGSDRQEPALVDANLQSSLVQYFGADGYAALLQRALALASVEIPALQARRVSPETLLEGTSNPISHAGIAREQAAVAVTAQILQLLDTFIGDFLTRKLVREACPNSLSDK
jgi:hypothetical protein